MTNEQALTVVRAVQGLSDGVLPSECHAALAKQLARMKQAKGEGPVGMGAGGRMDGPADINVLLQGVPQEVRLRAATNAYKVSPHIGLPGRGGRIVPAPDPDVTNALVEEEDWLVF